MIRPVHVAFKSDRLERVADAPCRIADIAILSLHHRGPQVRTVCACYAAASKAVKQFRLRELASVLTASSEASTLRPKVQNPFIPHKNPDSGRWAPPKYSLRRQAELIKHARASNTLHLLPPGPKLGSSQLSNVITSNEGSASSSSSEEPWTREVQWEGEVKEKVVPGAEVGNRLYAGKRRMFKGHKWERTREKRDETRELIMQTMDKRIQGFKTAYRRKRPSPISVPRNTSYSKLPF